MKNKYEISLTRLMRHKLDMHHVDYILDNFDVPPFVGALPPQLCQCVAPEKRADATYKFHQIISDFLANNLCYLNDLKRDIIMDIEPARQLFGTDCKLIARGMNICGCSPWSGLMAVVFKMTFPKIGAEYALKSFYKLDKEHRGHGALFEIQTAFAANHAEPRDNCPVYMASFIGKSEYMLSKWAGETQDGVIRQNNYEMFSMKACEAERRNYRNGRRIDFGQTRITSYGRLSYWGRKMFRTVMNAAERGYTAQIDYLYSTIVHPDQQREMEHVMELAAWTCIMEDKYPMLDIIELCMQRNR